MVEVSCLAIDASGQSTPTRTFVFGVPLYVSPCYCTLEDSHPITLMPSEGWTNITVEIGFYQGGEPRNVITITLPEETTVQLSSAGMVPGPVEVWIKAYTDPRYVMQAIYDLSIIKESTPPQITFSSHKWEGADLKVSGSIVIQMGKLSLSQQRSLGQTPKFSQSHPLVATHGNFFGTTLICHNIREI